MSGDDDFYQRLRNKIKSWAESSEAKKETTRWVLLAPDVFHLLTRLSVDPEVPPKHKLKLAGAIVYFVSPIDLIPEAVVGPIGYVEDVGLALYALNALINDVGPDIVRKRWAGDEDILALIQDFVKRGDDILGGGLVGKLKRLVDNPDRIADLFKRGKKKGGDGDGPALPAKTKGPGGDDDQTPATPGNKKKK